MLINASSFTQIEKAITAANDQTRPKGCKKKKGITYKDLHSAFDIESYNDIKRNRATMYIWQFAVNGDMWCYGRTWKEFKDFLSQISDKLYDDTHLVIWVHNLSYEFQFLKSVLDFEPDNVFAIKKRKVLYAVYKNFEFRCSYLQSNRSLADLCKAYGVQNQKLELDYSIERYPWTPLPEEDLAYSANDVLGLCQSMMKRCEGETFYTLPFTSTGYVRRDVRAAMYPNRRWLQKMQPTLAEYQILKECFRGGNTHANRNYTGRLLQNVLSMDKKSSYPSCMLYYEYPMSNFVKVEREDISIDDVLRLKYKRGKALLMRLAFWGISLKDDGEGFPDISASKCWKYDQGIEDNGRILYAEYIEITVNDIDLDILLDQYDFTDIRVLELWAADYGELPKEFKDVVISYFEKKTTLDGVAGMEIEYNKAKNAFNALFGMSVQSEDSQLLLYNVAKLVFEEDTKSLQEILDSFHKTPYKLYSWGVWTTSHARRELWRGLKAAGKNSVYCDTDSVKFVYNSLDERNEILARFEEINKEHIENSEKFHGCATTPKGEVKRLGVFEEDGDYRWFKTLGAKKYIVYDVTPKKDKESGKTFPKGLVLTCAGVQKKAGMDELIDKVRKRENLTINEIKFLHPEMVLNEFKDGCIFYSAAGLEAVYDDCHMWHDTIDGHDIEITSNVLLKDSTYEVGVTGEYDRIIENPAIWRTYMNDLESWESENRERERMRK